MYQLDRVVETLADLFDVSPVIRHERLTTGSPRFRNDVEWAKKILLEDGHVDHVPRRNWYVTSKGYRWIESVLRSRLARLNDEQLAQVTERCEFLRDDFPSLADDRIGALIRSNPQIKSLLQQPTELAKR